MVATTTVLMFPLLLIAIAIGFVLGRRPWRSEDVEPRGDYMRGLNYLIDEQADTAVDAFVGALDVNDDTVDTHLALGALVRRRGEHDKAIRLHQNLLARPRLSARFRARAELELARDYLAAGLLGRAESLLEDLASRGGNLRESALEHLLEVYQREREWQGAVDVARELAGKGEDHIRRTLAHFLCELAEQALTTDDVQAARRQFEQALEWDGACVRASLALGRLENSAGRHRAAIKAFERVIEQDARFTGEALPGLVAAHRELGAERDLMRLLEASLARAPSPALAAQFADLIAARSGEDAALAALTDALARSPSVEGLSLLLERYATVNPGLAPGLRSLKEFTDALVTAADPYLCQGCGLSGRVLHWQCPSCKAWGMTAPAGGAIAG